MMRLASSLASKFRLAKNSIQPVGRRFSRNFATQDIQFNGEKTLFKDYEYEDIFTSGVKNPACNVIDKDWFRDRVFKYKHVLERALCGNIVMAKKAGAVCDNLVNRDNLRNGIEVATQAVGEYLKRTARMISSSKEILQIIATVCDGRIGELTIKAVEKVGTEGLFITRKNDKMIHELEFSKGMKLNGGFICSSYKNDKEQGLCVLRNPLILIHENTISNQNVVEQAIRSTSYGFEPEVASYLVQGYESLGIEICADQCKESEENNRAIMQDLAIFTRGQVVTEVSDMNCIPFMLGSCKEVSVSLYSTVIVGGSGSQANTEERCEQLRSAIKMSSSRCEIKLLKERLVNLSSSVAIFKFNEAVDVIKAGGASVAEVRKNQIRISNALDIIPTVFNEGSVPSGGAALLHASKVLDELQLTNSVQKLGIKLVQHALKMPMYSLASRAGFDGSVVVEKLLKQDNPDLGFNPTTGEYVDMIKFGNKDPCLFVARELNKTIREFCGVFCPINWRMLKRPSYGRNADVMRGV